MSFSTLHSNKSPQVVIEIGKKDKRKTKNKMNIYHLPCHRTVRQRPLIDHPFERVHDKNNYVTLRVREDLRLCVPLDYSKRV